MQKRRVYNCIIVFLILLVAVAFICLFLWWNTQMQQRERITEDNSDYIDYSCQDSHLVCLIEGEPMGQCYKDIKSSSYCFRYTSIDEITEKEFVLAEVWQVAPMSFSNYIILQNPENEVNVLEDWHIKKVELQRIVSQKEETCEIVAECTSKDRIQNIIEAIEMPDVVYMDDNYNEEIYKEYKRIHEDGITMRIQLLFEETDSIGWISEINILQSKEKPSQYFVVLDMGEFSEELDYIYREILIDASSEFGRWVLEAYLQDELEE